MALRHVPPLYGPSNGDVVRPPGDRTTPWAPHVDPDPWSDLPGSGQGPVDYGRDVFFDVTPPEPKKGASTMKLWVWALIAAAILYFMNQ